MKQQLKTPLVYMHIPKTAGTSISETINKYADIQNDGVVNGINARHATQTDDSVGSFVEYMDSHTRNLSYLLAYLCENNTRYIKGHLYLRKEVMEKFHKQYCFMTILRNPVERWISHYIYNKLTNDDPLLLPCKYYNGSIEEELEATLISAVGIHLGNLASFMIGGFRTWNVEELEKAAQFAINNLEKFKIVGLTENLDFFVKKFESLFDIKLELTTTNVTKTRSTKDANFKSFIDLFDAKVRRRIEDLSYADMKLYNHAIKYFSLNT